MIKNKVTRETIQKNKEENMRCQRYSKVYQ